MSAKKSNEEQDLPLCKYGKDCYRKNPAHFAEFRHPFTTEQSRNLASSSQKSDDNKLKRKAQEEDVSESPSISTSVTNTKQRKLAVPDDDIPTVLSSQGSSTHSGIKSETKSTIESGDGKLLRNNHGIRLTTVGSGISPKWNKGCLGIKDILSMDADKLESSAQFSYMVDFQWLMNQYPRKNRDKPLLIVTGERGGSDARSLRVETEDFDNVQIGRARLEIPFGTHHTKMMLLKYSHGVRVVIHTANLVEQDWFLKTQGLYVSPLCPPLITSESGTASAAESGKNGDSSTQFRSELVGYLRSYRLKLMDEWIDILNSHDFSTVNVYLIASVPGRHQGNQNWGHLKLRKLLASRPMPEVDAGWPIVGQFSSIGSLGNDSDNWLKGEFLTSVAQNGGSVAPTSKPPIYLVYPTVENVRTSLEGYLAGGSLPYSMQTAKKQTYLRKFLHQWESNNCGRTTAAPHIKSYARFSPDCQKLSWFLLTSANLSKAAWGVLEKKNTQLMIRSYELGVLVMENSTLDAQLYLPFDLPLVEYSKTDQPWVVDWTYSNPDIHGTKWPIQ